jgi:hypothetical protein
MEIRGHKNAQNGAQKTIVVIVIVALAARLRIATSTCTTQ